MTTNSKMVETLATLTEMNISENLSQRPDFEGVKVGTRVTTMVDDEVHEAQLLVTLKNGQQLVVTVEKV